MKLYIEPIFAYNEFEQELQYLELSTLIEDDSGKAIRQNTLTFPPVFGIDRTLLGWLGKNEKLVGETNQKEEIEKELNEINNIITEETLVLTWNDVFMQLGQINSSKRIVVYHIPKDKTILEKVYFDITGININSRNSLDRLLATKAVYEHYRSSEYSLTDSIVTATITEDIDV